jgi:hypothetical protein
MNAVTLHDAFVRRVRRTTSAAAGGHGRDWRDLGVGLRRCDDDGWALRPGWRMLDCWGDLVKTSISIRQWLTSKVINSHAQGSEHASVRRHHPQ